MGAAGRLPDSSAPLWAPFFQLWWDRRARGSDFRERWTFENLIGALRGSLVFIFFELPLACYGDLRLANPLPARVRRPREGRGVGGNEPARYSSPG